MTAVSDLREAAAVLRQRANAATEGPWNLSSEDDPMDPYSIRTTSGRTVAEHCDWIDGEYIATVNPLVGFALADYLDKAASTAELLNTAVDRTLRGVALNILGRSET